MRSAELGDPLVCNDLGGVLLGDHIEFVQLICGEQDPRWTGELGVDDGDGMIAIVGVLLQLEAGQAVLVLDGRERRTSSLEGGARHSHRQVCVVHRAVQALLAIRRRGAGCGGIS